MKFWIVNHINCKLFLCPYADTHTHADLMHVWNWQHFEKRFCVCFIYFSEYKRLRFWRTRIAVIFALVKYPICLFLLHKDECMINCSFNSNNKIDRQRWGRKKFASAAATTTETHTIREFFYECVQLKSVTIAHIRYMHAYMYLKTTNDKQLNVKTVE